MDPGEPPVSHVLLFGPDQHGGRLGRYVFRLAELTPEGGPSENLTLNYSLRILQTQCAYWVWENRTWRTDGVRVRKGGKVGRGSERAPVSGTLCEQGKVLSPRECRVQKLSGSDVSTSS